MRDRPCRCSTSKPSQARPQRAPVVYRRPRSTARCISSRNTNPTTIPSTRSPWPAVEASASLAPPTSLGAGKGGDDYYILTSPAGTAPQLSLTLTSGPQVDLQLDVYAPTQNPGKVTPVACRRTRPRRGASVSRRWPHPGQVLYLRVRGGLVAAKPGTSPLPPLPPRWTISSRSPRRPHHSAVS